MIAGPVPSLLYPLRPSDPGVSSIRAGTVRRLARLNHAVWLSRLRALEAEGSIRVQVLQPVGHRLRSVTIFYRGSVRNLVARFRGIGPTVDNAGLPQPCPACGSEVTSKGNLLWCGACRRGYLPSRSRGIGIGVA